MAVPLVPTMRVRWRVKPLRSVGRAKPLTISASPPRSCVECRHRGARHKLIKMRVVCSVRGCDCERDLVVL